MAMQPGEARTFLARLRELCFPRVRLRLVASPAPDRLCRASYSLALFFRISLELAIWGNSNVMSLFTYFFFFSRGGRVDWRRRGPRGAFGLGAAMA